MRESELDLMIQQPVVLEFDDLTGKRTGHYGIEVKLLPLSVRRLEEIHWK